MTPAELRRCTVSDGPGQYNTAALQRERIACRLRTGPATRGELARECYCPSVTKRISELRRRGLPIRTAWTTETAPDGSVNPTAVYSLDEGEPRQGRLDL